jgi:hypothetical protein
MPNLYAVRLVFEEYVLAASPEDARQMVEAWVSRPTFASHVQLVGPGENPFLWPHSWPVEHAGEASITLAAAWTLAAPQPTPQETR